MIIFRCYLRDGSQMDWMGHAIKYVREESKKEVRVYVQEIEHRYTCVQMISYGPGRISQHLEQWGERN